MKVLRALSTYLHALPLDVPLELNMEAQARRYALTQRMKTWKLRCQSSASQNEYLHAAAVLQRLPTDNFVTLGFRQLLGSKP